MKVRFEKWSSIGLILEDDNGVSTSYVIPPLCEDLPLTDDDLAHISKMMARSQNQQISNAEWGNDFDAAPEFIDKFKKRFGYDR